MIYLFSVLATLPTPADMIAGIGAWSAPFFTDLLPFAIFAIGVILGAFLVSFLINTVGSVVSKLIHKD